ncbi:WD repeat-containing protein [Trichostrongylus colubriformis]|uniref:WD repeat-containing protein n=1 Tax=Trichostrongylus colubriformis TaxID=6319 RepID=A0AAN8GB14_TRICO
MNTGGRVGLGASSSREDTSRSRNASVRRNCYAPQDGAVGAPPLSAVRGYGSRRRWAYRQEPPLQVTNIACAQNNQSQNIRRQNFSINGRETGHKRRRGRSRRNHSEVHDIAIGDEFPVIEERNPIEEGYPCFPGFVFDPATRKYFRIAPDHSGINTYTPKGIARSRREKERCAQLALSRSQLNICSRLRSTIPTVTSVSDRTLGTRSFNHVIRNVYEGRLLRIGSLPNAVQETPLGSSGEHVKGCQFLEFVGNSDDSKLLGCWAIGDGSRNSRKAAKLACLRTHFDDDVARKAASNMDETILRNSGTTCNTLGLEFLKDGETIDVAQPVLVDMAIAPVDSDVTCVLYVTAESRVTDQGISAICHLFLQPMSALCTDDDDFEVRNSPIYNIQCSVEFSAIYSCAWNSNKTLIALGMEESAKIIDVIAEKSFTISSRRRNVISQHFAPDGNLIYMGLIDSDVILSDLRMKSHHVTGSLKGSCSSGWIHQLRSSYPQCVLIENFRGELKLYDSRRSDRELMSFRGHRNTHFRLPCTVDCQENFVFAVGSDGCTRGWSLASGDLLCAVPCPRPVDDRTDFPRVLYSSAWGGRAGSSALVLAVGDSLRIHHLEL